MSTRDSNGNEIADDHPDQFECQIGKATVVLKTEFVKKV
jgi:uncharacterized Zn ribbon protein